MLINPDDIELDFPLDEDITISPDEIDPLEDFSDFIRPKRKKKEKKETEEYINKDEMWVEFFNYYSSLGINYCWDTQKLKDKTVYGHISDKLINMINDISIKLGYRPNYLNYSYLDEMRSDAKVKMVKAIRDASFKCFATCKVVEIIETDNIKTVVYLDDKFFKKHGKCKEKPVEPTDHFFIGKDGEYITFRLNAFGYYSRICDNCYLNRIKKEKLADSTKKAYQELTWNAKLAEESWMGVRRPRNLDSDENEHFYEE